MSSIRNSAGDATARSGSSTRRQTEAPVAIKVEEPPAEPTPAQRRERRNMNAVARRAQAATRLQAAYRGKKARRENMREGHQARGSGELLARLEPTVVIVVSLTFGMQWDQAVVYEIGDVANASGLVAVNGLLTMVYTAVLTFVLMAVHEGHNRRLLNLFKLCLQTLVGWMWRSCIELADLNLGRYYMAGAGYSLANAMWARFGLALGTSCGWAESRLCHVPRHPERCSALRRLELSSPRLASVSRFSPSLPPPLATLPLPVPPWRGRPDSPAQALRSSSRPFSRCSSPRCSTPTAPVRVIHSPSSFRSSSFARRPSSPVSPGIVSWCVPR
jgi:hypothetical protein